MSDLIKIPIINSIDFNEDIIFEDFTNTVEIPKSQVARQLHKGEKLFALLIKDYTAKDALLLPDDIVVLIKSNLNLKDGSFVAININKQIKFGYLFGQKDEYKLMQVHPLAKPIFLNSPNNFTVIGRVILVIRNNIDEDITEKASPAPIAHNKLRISLQEKKRRNILRLIVFLSLIILASWAILNLFDVKWPIWTGFQQKTLWDWLELLIIPIVISFGIFLLNQNQKLSDQKGIEENLRENALQQYLDKMTDLLLNNKYKSPKEKSKQLHMARTRTLTILRGLDGERKGIIIRFLYEANLILGPDEQVEIQLIESDLSYSNLSYAYLSEINLNGTHLHNANFQSSDISNSLFQGCFLYGANLSNTNMIGADLQSANLENADLTNADLSNANLSNTKVTLMQLKKAKSFDGAILPKQISASLFLQEIKEDKS